MHSPGLGRGAAGGTDELARGSVVVWQCGEGPGDFVALTIDHCVAVGTSGAFVAGWLLETAGQVSELQLSENGDAGVDPREAGTRIPRGDVLEGFAEELAAADVLETSPEIGFLHYLPFSRAGEPGPLSLTCTGSFETRTFQIIPATDADQLDQLIDAYGRLVEDRLPTGASADVAAETRPPTGPASINGGQAKEEKLAVPIVDRESPSERGLQLGRPVAWSPAQDSPDFVALAVDHCVRAGDAGILVTGWYLSTVADADRSQLSFRCGGGAAVGPMPGSARARPDVLAGLAHRLRAANAERRSDKVGFAVLVPLPGDAQPPSQVTIACPAAGGVPEFHVDTQDSADRISAVVLAEWDVVSKALAPHLGPALDKSWWTALVRDAPRLTHQSRVNVQVDRCVRIPGTGPVLTGWWIKGTADDVRVYVCTEDAEVADLTACMISDYRRDIYEMHKDEFGLRNLEQGFIGHLAELPADEDVELSGIAATHDEIFGRFDAGAPARAGSPLKDVEALLAPVGITNPQLRRVMDTVGDAVRRVWDTRPKPAGNVEAFDFGPVPEDPKLSIIVPIYGRWDFIEYQLALFSRDPEMRQHELLYMIDDPEIFDTVMFYARASHPAFEVPFRIVYGHDNFGYAGANNAAASVARGEYLLLLNSDVMPKEPGWSGKLLDTFARLDNPGVAGVRLLFHDGSIQHAGMRFKRSVAWGSMWANTHPGKGQPVSTDPADGPTEVDAVTGACMLIPAALYHEVGGLDDGFVRGDFEDSDLCLKLAAKGYRVYYLPDIELYHLERQSQNLADENSVRAKFTIYNCWRHTDRWEETIQRIAGEKRSG